jgi:release factor glutamine methyltransferase
VSGTGVERTDAVVRRLRAAGCVFAEDEAALLVAESTGPVDLEHRIARRENGEPLEYILGWAEFCGLRIAVGHGVFVPRRRTAVLAREASALVAATSDPKPVILDLCSGSGAIAAVIAAAHPSAEIHAADIDPDAVALARLNLPDRAVYESDLFASVPDRLRRRIDVLTVNAPYVPTAAIARMPPEARDHEHRIALDGGADGLDLHRRVIDDAPLWLAPGGHVLLESSQDQAPITAALMRATGLTAHIAHDEDIDGTAIIGRWPGR